MTSRGDRDSQQSLAHPQTCHRQSSLLADLLMSSLHELRDDLWIQERRDDWDLLLPRDISCHIPLDEPVSEGQVEILKSFVWLQRFLELRKARPDILQLCLGHATSLRMLLGDARRPELDIFDIRSPGDEDLLRSPQDLAILKDIHDLPLSLEDCQVLLRDPSDGLPDPRVLRDLVSTY